MPHAIICSHDIQIIEYMQVIIYIHYSAYLLPRNKFISLSTSFFVSEYAGDGYQASKHANGSIVHVHGNGREVLNNSLRRVGDGDVHPGHACVGDDVWPIHEYGDARAVPGKDIKRPLS